MQAFHAIFLYSVLPQYTTNKEHIARNRKSISLEQHEQVLVVFRSIVFFTTDLYDR